MEIRKKESNKTAMGETDKKKLAGKKAAATKEKAAAALKQGGKKVKALATTRQAIFGGNMALAILVVLGIVVAINYIASYSTVRWDLTKTKEYTLAPQTQEVVERVDSEMKILAFFQPGTQVETEDLLNEYAAINSNIKVEIIDPDAKPAVARQYGVERYGTVVFEQGDRKETSLGLTESDITSSILKMVSDETRFAYFTSGHGEKDIEGTDEKSYLSVKSTLEKEGYEVQKLTLATSDEIPEDASVLIVAGPRKKFVDKEKEAIEKYLNEGGRVMFLLDPKADGGADPELDDLLAKWGVELKEGVVIDPNSHFWTDVGSPAVQEWPPHQISSQLTLVFYPGAGLVDAKGDLPENITVDKLASSSSGSWLETQAGTQAVKFDQGEGDIEGPITMAVAVQQTTEDEDGARIVVVGDSDFANEAFIELGNIDFFMNSVNWLTKAEDLISIRPKESEDRSVTLTGEQYKYVLYVTVVLMPLAVVIIGIIVGVKRRKKKRR